MKRVMIVDDAMFIRSSLKMMLQKNQFEVVAEASNGREAVKMYEIHKPDIVTMDITMPEMDGIEALKLIKKMDSQSKVVMISAMGNEAAVMEAIMAGAANFIVKPFKEDKVMQVLDKVK